MNRLTVFAALALCLPLTARADDASQHAKAQQLVAILHADVMVNQVTVVIKKRVSDAAAKAVGPNPTPENQAKLADFQKKASDQIDAELNWKVIGPAFVESYVKNFTEPELDAIIAFFKSPAGATFLEKTPAVNAQTTQFTQSKVTALQQELNQSFEQFRQSQAPPEASPATKTPPTLGSPK
jgi:uncharacterized protein